MKPVRVLEVGGTHVTAALVDLDQRQVVGQVHRVDLDSQGTQEQILGVMLEAGRMLPVDQVEPCWAVAMPGPFDYERGIGDFQGVDKFQALKGVDVRAALATGLRTPERLDAQVLFVNDVTAFGLGQYLFEPAPRLVVMTLGTGIGSCFLQDGVPIEGDPRVPELGWMCTLTVQGRPLEEVVSRNALMRDYRELTGNPLSVREIAELARAGDEQATQVFRTGYQVLGRALAPWLVRFGAERVVVGGSIAQSWDLVERWLVPAVAEAGSDAQFVHATDFERAALVGAASIVAGGAQQALNNH